MSNEDPMTQIDDALRATSSLPDGERFPGASVVQLVGGDPADVAADVTVREETTVVVDRIGVHAGDGELGWTWSFGDLKRVVHGHAASWTIFDVPGVSDFGVAVRSEDVPRFRTLVDRSARDTVVHQSPAADADATPPNGARSPQPAPPASAGAVAAAPKQKRASLFRGAVIDRVEDVSGPVALTGLEAQSISAWFGTHQVLDRVSLDMRAGEITALIGPSGCGKSTFLRILNRMHEMIPSASMAGRVMLDGQDVYDPNRKLTDARREIGMVFQKPNPFPAMAIYDNVLAGLRVTGTKATRGVKDALVESCLTKAGLWNEVKDRLRQPGGGLSGGQQQRLCIARALAIRPRVLLMDEPCSALDPTSTRRIEETMMDLVSEVTIVIVTHNMQQAARVSDQCAFFLAEHGTPGVIVEHGPTTHMFSSPQDPRTHDYVNGRFG